MLIAGVVVMTMVSISVMGPMVSGELAKAGSALAFDDATESTTTTLTPVVAPPEKGGCSNGWDLVGAGQTKKNGKNVDANKDGQICRKDIPGKGGGNTGNNQNVKDNN